MYAILPEVVGKLYSRRPVADTDGIVDISDPQQSTTAEDKEQEEDPDKPWCYCGQPSYGEMILCDNKACTIRWVPPKGKWYCPSCAKLLSTKRKTSCIYMYTYVCETIAGHKFTHAQQTVTTNFYLLLM